jgi:tRNA nucleotidyltransferase (CCA-adding enzyme)
MDVITTHMNADFDCLGAMIAARRLYPDALMVFSGSQEKSMRDFFLKSTSYAFNFTRIKDLDLEKIERLILVDCQHASRIGPFAAIIGRPGLEIHIYDHHPDVEGRIVPSGGMVRSCGSSTTILATILRERGESLTPAEATLMMLGIYEDTGRLTFPGTTVEDYQAAAWLLQQGAQLNTVADFVSQELTAEQVELLNDLLHSLKQISCNGIEINIAHASREYYVSDVAALAHMMRDMESLEVLFLVVEMGSRIYLVARSRSLAVNVGEILREFGGGGHATAASATVRDLTVIQVLDKLEEILLRRIRSLHTVGAIMSSPVKSMAAATTIAESRELLTRYNVNAMPVMQDGEMIGVISRQIVEKAIYHELGGLPVSEYMHTEFFRATPDTSVTELREYLTGHNRRFVPVFTDNRLVGVVTRTDLLRYMHSGDRVTGLASDATPQNREVEARMKRSLSPRILHLLRDLGTMGDDLGYRVYAVGGFVRDLLLGEENLDIDITVEGDGIRFAVEFAARHDCRMKSHEKFGTAVILVSDDLKVDVASTRMEYYDSPGVLPTVESSSLKMDLYRRDFTINTLAISLGRAEFGRLVDFFGAQRDLKEKSIRVLHNLSFVEDPTRVFRAIRFEQRLGFHIAVHTENLIRNAVRMDFLDRLGGRRLLAELVNILREKEPLHAVERMASLGLLRYLNPALKFTPEIRAQLEDCSQIITWFELLYLQRPYERWAVYFLTLCSTLDHDQFMETCVRLSVSGHYRQRLTESRRHAFAVLDDMVLRSRKGKQPRQSELYRWLKEMPVEMLLHMMARTGREDIRRNISTFVTHLSSVKTIINGDDLITLGVPKGPAYRIILDKLLDARLDGMVTSREDEVALAEKLLAELRITSANLGK